MPVCEIFWLVQGFTMSSYLWSFYCLSFKQHSFRHLALLYETGSGKQTSLQPRIGAEDSILLGHIRPCKTELLAGKLGIDQSTAQSIVCCRKRLDPKNTVARLRDGRRRTKVNEMRRELEHNQRKPSGHAPWQELWALAKFVKEA